MQTCDVELILLILCGSETHKVTEAQRAEMAEKGAEMDRASPSCTICLELLNDPVTIPCGHSYCMKCIQDYWSQKWGEASCPQCRQTFTPRPVLRKNTTLASLCVRLKRRAPQAATADPLHSALQKKLKLVVPPKEQKNLCPLHNEVMEMFCLTDQQSICGICLVYECRSHPTVSAAAEREERQSQLQDSRLVIQQRLQKAKRDVGRLEQEVKAVNASAHRTLEVCEELRQQIRVVKQQVRSRQQTEVSRARELQEKLQQEIAVLKRRDSQLEQLIHTPDHIQFLQNYPSVSALPQPIQSPSFQPAALSYFEGVTAAVSEVGHKLQNTLKETPTDPSVRVTEDLQSHLEPTTRDEEMAVTRRKGDQIKQLSRTQDRTMFLQNYPSLSALRQPIQSSSFQPAALSYSEGVAAAVSEVGHKLQNVLRVTPTDISARVTEVQQRHPEPTTRDELLRYACKVTLDPNTAHRRVKLSEGNTKAEHLYRIQPYPSHPDRFTGCFQVLSKEGLTGRCYWEVAFAGEASIAVSYKSISRAGGGNECGFGFNAQSCALQWYRGDYKFWHNNVVTPVSGPYTSRVGVYLDHTAGILSFYSISDTVTLLHRGQTTFTEPLYAGVWLSNMLSSAEVLSSANSDKLRALRV